MSFHSRWNRGRTLIRAPRNVHKLDLPKLHHQFSLDLHALLCPYVVAGLDPELEKAAREIQRRAARWTPPVNPAAPNSTKPASRRLRDNGEDPRE